MRPASVFFLSRGQAAWLGSFGNVSRLVEVISALGHRLRTDYVGAMSMRQTFFDAFWESRGHSRWATRAPAIDDLRPEFGESAATVMPPSPPRGEDAWPQSRIEVFAKCMANWYQPWLKSKPRTRHRKTRRASPLEEQVVMMSRSDQSADLKLCGDEYPHRCRHTAVQSLFYRDVLGAKGPRKK